METFGNFNISCFSFFLLDLQFLVHPSIILWLILKIKINESFGCLLQQAKLQRQNYFLEPCKELLKPHPFPLLIYYYQLHIDT